MTFEEYVKNRIENDYLLSKRLKGNDDAVSCIEKEMVLLQSLLNSWRDM